MISYRPLVALAGLLSLGSALAHGIDGETHRNPDAGASWQELMGPGNLNSKKLKMLAS